jgi:hypothetical protein
MRKMVQALVGIIPRNHFTISAMLIFFYPKKIYVKKLIENAISACQIQEDQAVVS